MAKVILFNKPFDVLCQFTDSEERQTLANFIKGEQYKGFYPAGRLDRDSEGLLILTNNGALQDQIAHPRHHHKKTYWVQVEGEITPQAISSLQNGIELKDGLTKPAIASIIPEPTLWARSKPIRERKNIPTSWIELTISEGKNRQVRRMTAAVGFPTLRLVRYAVSQWNLRQEGSLIESGQFRVLEVEEPKTQKKPRRQGSKSNSVKDHTKFKTRVRRDKK